MKKLILFIGALASVAYAQKAPRIQTFQELIKAPKEASGAVANDKILGVTHKVFRISNNERILKLGTSINFMLGCHYTTVISL